MLAQTPQKIWQINSARSVVTDGRYAFLAIAPQSLSQDQALALLIQQGWDGPRPNTAPSMSAVTGDWATSFAPTINLVIAEFTKNNLPTPHFSVVEGTWKGQPATLPVKTGDLIIGPIYTEQLVSPPAPPATSSKSAWPAILGLAGVAVLVGGAWWISKKQSRYTFARYT